MHTALPVMVITFGDGPLHPSSIPVAVPACGPATDVERVTFSLS